MSLLGIKPKIEGILESLSASDLTTLDALLNTAPLNISAYESGDMPTDKGNVFIARVDGHTGYVIYTGGKKYLIAYVNYDCTQYQIFNEGLVDLNEYLSILELRYEVSRLVQENNSVPAGKINVIDFNATRSGTTLTCNSTEWASTDIKQNCLYLLDISYAITGDTVSSDTVVLHFADGVTTNIYSSINTTGVAKLLDLEQVQFPYSSTTGHRYIFMAIASTNSAGNLIFGMIPSTSQQDIISSNNAELSAIAAGTIAFEYNNEQLFYCVDTVADAYTMGHIYQASYNFSTNAVTFTDLTPASGGTGDVTTDTEQTISGIKHFTADVSGSTTGIAIGCNSSNNNYYIKAGNYIILNYDKANNNLLLGGQITGTDCSLALSIGASAFSSNKGISINGRNAYAGGISIGHNSESREGSIAIGSDYSGQVNAGNTTYTISQGSNSIAIGSFANCFAGYGISIGDNSYTESSTYYSISIGASSKSNKYASVAIGYAALCYISHTFSIDGASLYTTNTYTAYDTDHFFFRNEYVDSTKTTLSAYTKGHTLTEYLGKTAPASITDTIEAIIGGTSANFTKSGTGTSADPYIITPTVSTILAHNNNLYNVSISTAPAGIIYVHFKSATGEKCNISITNSITAASNYYNISFYNISGVERFGLEATGTINNVLANTAYTALVDINSCDIWQNPNM